MHDKSLTHSIKWKSDVGKNSMEHRKITYRSLRCGVGGEWKALVEQKGKPTNKFLPRINIKKRSWGP